MKKKYFGEKKFDRDYFTGKIPVGYPGGYNKKTLGGYDCWTRFEEDAKLIKKLGVKSYFEIGCACGYLMSELLKLGIKVKGWDISEYIVKKADKKVRPFIDIKDIGEINCLPDKSFDLVHVSTVLGYVPLKKLDYYLRQIRRISKKYVIVYVGTPAKSDSPEETPIRLINQPESWWNKKFAEYFKVENLKNYLWKVE